MTSKTSKTSKRSWTVQAFGASDAQWRQVTQAFEALRPRSGLRHDKKMAARGLAVYKSKGTSPTFGAKKEYLRLVPSCILWMWGRWFSSQSHWATEASANAKTDHHSSSREVVVTCVLCGPSIWPIRPLEPGQRTTAFFFVDPWIVISLTSKSSRWLYCDSSLTLCCRNSG